MVQKERGKAVLRGGRRLGCCWAAEEGVAGRLASHISQEGRASSLRKVHTSHVHPLILAHERRKQQ